MTGVAHKVGVDASENVALMQIGLDMSIIFHCILNGRILKESELVFRLAIQKEESASIVQRNTSWQYQRTLALP